MCDEVKSIGKKSIDEKMNEHHNAKPKHFAVFEDEWEHRLTEEQCLGGRRVFTYLIHIAQLNSATTTCADGIQGG